jgi:hypothetical protein
VPRLPACSSPPAQGEPEPQGYNLNQVLKIDRYSRKIFPILYGTFVAYFFVRFYAIEGALSIEY